jgi:hypothetical protein
MNIPSLSRTRGPLVQPSAGSRRVGVAQVCFRVKTVKREDNGDSLLTRLYQAQDARLS